MPNRISVTIAGQQYTILAEESEEYTQQVAKRADHKIAEAKTVTDASMLNAAVLAALNLADEATKAERDVERTRGELSERAEQAEAMREAEKGVNQISGVVQNNAATAQESSATSEELSAQTIALNEHISKFILE